MLQVMMTVVALKTQMSQMQNDSVTVRKYSFTELSQFLLSWPPPCLTLIATGMHAHGVKETPG